MFKKILMWTVYALIVGLLVFGAANRTSAKTDQGILFGIPDEISDGRGQGNGGSGNFEQSGEPEDYDHEQISVVHDWVSFNGQVLAVDASTLLIQTVNTELLEIAGRSWRFAGELGYLPEEGNEVHVEGFYENGEFEVSSILDLSTGQSILLRDEYGHPLWGGGGRN